MTDNLQPQEPAPLEAYQEPPEGPVNGLARTGLLLSLLGLPWEQVQRLLPEPARRPVTGCCPGSIERESLR